MGKTYAQVLKAEIEKADSAPISGGKTREQLTSQSRRNHQDTMRSSRQCSPHRPCGRSSAVEARTGSIVNDLAAALQNRRAKNLTYQRTLRKAEGEKHENRTFTWKLHMTTQSQDS